jgi:hypothetical protein
MTLGSSRRDDPAKQAWHLDEGGASRPSSVERGQLLDEVLPRFVRQREEAPSTLDVSATQRMSNVHPTSKDSLGVHRDRRPL